MIIKSHDLKRFLNKEVNIFLFYGQNSELIEETIQNDIKPTFTKNFYNYDEIEILSNKNGFEESVFNKSFFDNEKLIIINRV
ncbi:DNA polymerase III subunit delta, partial [Candidatus Pelagibacter sp.]|nr:DNA polymerase III subunit delta [Candidatus Pelagibacter sp.]